MCSNRVKQNTDKTNFILLGTRQQIGKASFHSIQLDGIDVHFSTTVICLGVLIDSESAHIKRFTRWCLYQRHQLRTVRRARSVEASRTFVHAFVISRVDYCNSIFGSTSAVHLRPLQCVLMLKRTRSSRDGNSIASATLRDELHWLPVQYRHTNKIYLLFYNHFIGTDPSYLVEPCIPVAANLARSSLRNQPRPHVSADKPGTLRSA